MPPDTQEEFLQKFHARRMAKHETNKRKADSPSQTPQDPPRFVRTFDGDDPPEMSFDVSKSDLYPDGEPGPAVEATSTRQTTSVAQKPAQDDGSTLDSKPAQPTTLDKADQCAKITADNERAQAEIEAAGILVKDFATGYETIVTDRA